MALLTAYQGLLQLSRAQKAALSEPELEGFFGLGGQRESLFERLQALEAEEIEPETRDQIRDLIAKILETDREIEAELLQRSTTNRQEIAQLQPGVNALQAYLQDSGSDSFFIDKNH